MKEGDIVLTPILQADNRIKNRPAIFLRVMPPYGDALVCGVSTQLHQEVPGFDDVISGADEDNSDSGLVADSLIRLGFLAVIPQSKLLGSIGSISAERHRRLLQKLSGYLLRSG
jgi:mRNA interferase MazF